MRTTACFVWLFLTCSVQAQTEVQAGYVLGVNSYFDSKQDNISTKFNLGWDLDGSFGTVKLDFVPGTTNYEIQNKMNWHRTTHGILLGAGFLTDNKVSFDINYTGCTNSESGSRTNLETNVQEKLTLKTKFGGVQVLALIHLNDHFSLNAGLGVNLFRTRYSWSGVKDVKNQTIGLRVNPFSQELKAGDRSLTLVVPVGFTIKLLDFTGLSLKSRVNYTFVWNDMVKTDLIYEFPYSYNLNNLSLSLFLTKTI